MRKMNYADVIIDGYNAVVGTVVAVLSYVLGEHWMLFCCSMWQTGLRAG